MALTWIIRDPKLKVRTKLVINDNIEKQDENQYRSSGIVFYWDTIGWGEVGEREREMHNPWIEYVLSLRVKYIDIGWEFI